MNKFTQAVKAAIAEQGLKKAYVAERLHITPQSLSNKLNEKAPWSADEAATLTKLLKIPPDIWLG